MRIDKFISQMLQILIEINFHILLVLFYMNISRKQPFI